MFKRGHEACGGIVTLSAHPLPLGEDPFGEPANQSGKLLRKFERKLLALGRKYLSASLVSDSGGRAAGRESLSSRQPAWASLGGNPSVKALENTLLANHEVVCDATVKTTPPGGHVLLRI
jgi:hypothetical protein